MASNTTNNGVRQDDLQKIFIASTQEAIDTGWLTAAITEAAERVEEKHPEVDFEPWYNAFNPGDITAERLTEMAAQVLGAVIVLTGDDQVESRDETILAPRDNLLVETGLFWGQLGLQNVLLLKQKGSKWPSDFAGVTPKQFKLPDDDDSGRTAIVAKDIAMALSTFAERLVRANSSVATRAIHDSMRRLRREADRLNLLLDQQSSDQPVQDPEPANAYLHAVTEVQEKFTTTTYLKSEFWTSRELRVTAANQQMLKRVTGAGGKARRIILLPRPLDEELKDQRRSRRLARSRAPQKVDQMNREFRLMENANRDLVREGFEVRVVYDRNEEHRHLPETIDFDENDTELALYDGARLDVFAGFTTKKRSTVSSYFNDYFEDFPALRQSVERYFDDLWDLPDAEDFESFAEKMRDLIEDVEHEIDYTEHWLATYDYQTGPDGELKQGESEFVMERLRTYHGNGNGLAEGHIDLGSCTGRYMSEIADLVAPGGTIVGIDNDQDCIDMLRHKRESGALDKRVTPEFGDIRYRDKLPEGKFPIVTCMMGTLCHLPRAAKEGALFQDEWQLGLEHIADLLSEEGNAFIAVWEERVCDEDRDVLDIYSSHAKEILCARTPSSGELAERLDQVGLRTVGAESIQGRLRVFHLRHLDREGEP